MDEIRKSINSILYDRIVSPLSGTFILSWVTFNWRILYVTIFQTSEELGKNKVEFVQDELNLLRGIAWPLISTVILLTIYPRISEYAYQLSLYHRGRKRKLKNKYEESQLLTLEQSIAIRLQVKSQLERIEKITSDKDEDIATLKAQNEGLVNRLSVFEKRVNEQQEPGASKNKPEQSMDDDFQIFVSNESNKKVLQDLHHRQPVWSSGEFGRANFKMIKELELLELVEGKANSQGGYNYTISDKGKSYLKRVLKK